MSTDPDNNELLDSFKAYLEQKKSDHLATFAQPDLATLLSEMATLKTEVKTESRQFKSTLDTLSSTLAAVQEDNRALSDALAVHKDLLQQQQTEITHNLLLEVVDIYDRLSDGLDVLQNYRPVSTFFNRSKDQDVRFIERFKQGQVMTCNRFQQLLQRYQVEETSCVGRLFDPMTMTAVEVSHEPTLENGMVLEELRKGFLFQNQVLRLAEVKVNKIR